MEQKPRLVLNIIKKVPSPKLVVIEPSREDILYNLLMKYINENCMFQSGLLDNTIYYATNKDLHKEYCKYSNISELDVPINTTFPKLMRRFIAKHGKENGLVYHRINRGKPGMPGYASGWSVDGMFIKGNIRKVNKKGLGDAGLADLEHKRIMAEARGDYSLSGRLFFTAEMLKQLFPDINDNTGPIQEQEKSKPRTPDLVMPKIGKIEQRIEEIEAKNDFECEESTMELMNKYGLIERTKHGKINVMKTKQKLVERYQLIRDKEGLDEEEVMTVDKLIDEIDDVVSEIVEHMTDDTQ